MKKLPFSTILLGGLMVLAGLLLCAILTTSPWSNQSMKSGQNVKSKSKPGKNQEIPSNQEAPKALAHLLADLHGKDQELREAALKAIKDIAKEGLSPKEVTAIIRTSVSDLPPSKFDWNAYDAALLTATWNHCQDEHIPLLVEGYAGFSENGRAAALAALSHIGSNKGATAFIALLREHGWPKKHYPAIMNPFVNNFRFGAILLPAFADDSIRDLPNFVRFSLILDYGISGELPDAISNAARPKAIQFLRETIKVLGKLQGADGVAWRWEEAYSEHRNEAGLVLDVLGHLGKSNEVVEILRQAECLMDPRLKLFALLSLLRLGELPGEAVLSSVASDAETRGMLFSQLKAMGRLELFPKSELDQAKLAESEMVGWLMYPTELGRAPDQIELMNTIDRDLGHGRGVLVYYIFRFRTKPPHWAAKNGWLAGISGPFRKSDFPTLDSWGETFSTFTSWEKFSAEKHLSSVQDLLERWRVLNEKK